MDNSRLEGGVVEVVKEECQAEITTRRNKECERTPLKKPFSNQMLNKSVVEELEASRMGQLTSLV